MSGPVLRALSIFYSLYCEVDAILSPLHSFENPGPERLSKLRKLEQG